MRCTPSGRLAITPTSAFCAPFPFPFPNPNPLHTKIMNHHLFGGFITHWHFGHFHGGGAIASLAVVVVGCLVLLLVTRKID